MELLYPNFLWALLATMIPVIIHLFYFKRFKKVYFSNTRFLKEIKEETTNKNKLKNLLVLLARILAIIFLVLAFAQPYIPVGEKIKKGSVGVSIFIDNSFSMQTLSEDVPLIDKAKKTALDIVNGFPEDAQFQILTNKLYGNEQKWINRQNAIENIEKVKLQPFVKTFKNISNRQKQAFETNDIDNKYIYWISDFQKSIFDIDSSVIDTLHEFNFIMLQPVRERNISIDSCYWENPVPIINQTNRLLVKLSNNSTDDVTDIPVNFKYNGQSYPSGKIDLKAQSSKIDTIDVRIKSTGWNEAEVNIIDFPVIFDDKYHIAFNVPEKIQILNINNNSQPNVYLKAAFQSNNNFNFKHSNINQVDYSKLPENQLIILEDVINISSGLNSSLKSAITKGSNLIVFPNKNMNINSVNEFLNSLNTNIFTQFLDQNNEASNLNKNEFVFKNVYEKINRNINPILVKGSFLLSNFQRKNTYHIIKFKNGQSFIDRYQFGRGNIYLCASPLSENFSDIAKNADIFVPLLFKMSISSKSIDKLSYTLGEDQNIELKKSNSSDLINIIGNGIEFIPRQLQTSGNLSGDNNLRIDVSVQIKESGIYEVVSEKKLLKKIAFNYNRKESKLDYVDEKSIKNNFNNKVNVFGKNDNKVNFTEMINSKQRGIELWKWSIILALLFLAFEILLLRFWKSK